MSIRKVPFGTLESGEAADLYILTNASGASVEITNFGGIIRAINVPDREGKLGNVVLGYKDVSGYQPLCGYLGALIGRVGNRIADGKCVAGRQGTDAGQERGRRHPPARRQRRLRPQVLGRDPHRGHLRGQPHPQVHLPGRRGGLSRHPEGDGHLHLHRRQRAGPSTTRPFPTRTRSATSPTTPTSTSRARAAAPSKTT